MRLGVLPWRLGLPKVAKKSSSNSSKGNRARRSKLRDNNNSKARELDSRNRVPICPSRCRFRGLLTRIVQRTEVPVRVRAREAYGPLLILLRAIEVSQSAIS